MINGGVNHDHPHPSHQKHLHVYVLLEFKLVEIAENFNKSVINDIYRLIIVIYITKYCLQAIAVELLIENLLISMAILNAV